MADIVLTTLNAKYLHTAFGLRYLLANLGSLQPRACIKEFDINQRPIEIVEGLLLEKPRILGCGVYIWNATETFEVLTILKQVRPEIVVILGGPEVSYETQDQPLVGLADYVITGEADVKFGEVCQRLLNGSPPEEKVIAAGLPQFSQLRLPYDLYTEEDLNQRVVYVEASRGCPFTCEFCLSSLDIPVRQVPLPQLLASLDRLLQRGLKHFKFVDRTFNLNVAVSRGILEFFLQRYQPGCFFHFEMVPDRLPEGLREVIARFPEGALQFEVGIQTFNPQVGALIKRRQNYEQLDQNLRYLRKHTGVHLHADLIVGLPGETLESFATGFDRLVALGPQEIQVGILKRLRGTPIVRHDTEWAMVYSQLPPYEILQNRLLDFATMQKLRRFARFWDLVGNSGNFIETTPLLWLPYDHNRPRSPFHSFLQWSEWLHAQIRRTDGIALKRLMEFLFEYLTDHTGQDRALVARKMLADYQRGGRKDRPPFLRPYLPAAISPALHSSRPPVGLRRQARHGLAPSASQGNIPP